MNIIEAAIDEYYKNLNSGILKYAKDFFGDYVKEFIFTNNGLEFIDIKINNNNRYSISLIFDKDWECFYIKYYRSDIHYYTVMKDKYGKEGDEPWIGKTKITDMKTLGEALLELHRDFLILRYS